MSRRPHPRDRQLQIGGWLLFIASALCFTLASWQQGDPLSLTGSLLFFIACFVFLIPLWRSP